MINTLLERIGVQKRLPVFTEGERVQAERELVCSEDRAAAALEQAWNRYWFAVLFTGCCLLIVASVLLGTMNPHG